MIGLALQGVCPLYCGQYARVVDRFSAAVDSFAWFIRKAAISDNSRETEALKARIDTNIFNARFRCENDRFYRSQIYTRVPFGEQAL